MIAGNNNFQQMKKISSLKPFLLPVPVLAMLLQMITFREVPENHGKTYPSIVSIHPDHGKAGDIIEITVINLGSFIPGLDRITINGKVAEVIEVSSMDVARKQFPGKTLSGSVKLMIGGAIRKGLLFSDVNGKIEPDVNRRNKPKEVICLYSQLHEGFIEQNRLLFKDKPQPEKHIFDEFLTIKLRVPQNAGNGPVYVIVGERLIGGQVFNYDWSPEKHTLSPPGIIAQAISEN